MDAGDFRKRPSRTGGRDATRGVIPGRYALSVGVPAIPPPSGWRWTPLGEVAQLESGHTPSRQHPEYWDGGIPWVGIRDAVDNHGCTIFDTVQHVAQLGLENSSARLLPAGTVCLSRTASVGYVVVMGRPMATSQDFVNWVCGPNLEPSYLKYILLAENESLLRFASGTTHQTIYYPEAKAFHALLPPLAEQRRILGVLEPLHDKIELNRRMNETLESIARVLFKSWFVNFDPVRAKAEGRAPASMDAAAATLFPSRFEAGVPQGWTVSTVGALVELERGSTYKSALKGEAGPYLLGLGSIQRNGCFRADKLVRYGGESPARMLLGPGDLYVSLKDVTQSADLLGAVARVPSYVKEGRLTQDTVKLVLRDGRETAQVLYRTLLTPEYREFCRAHATGTTNLGLDRDDFLSYPVVLPDGPVLRYFNTVMGAMDRRMDVAAVEAITLTQLRDALLPKLLSGELRIREAERIVERAV